MLANRMLMAIGYTIADWFNFVKTYARISAMGFRPTTATNNEIDGIDGLSKYLGGTLAPNGVIYGIPFNSTSILKINPEDDTVTTFGSVSTGANKYAGGVLAPNGMIYGIPFNSTSILKINPEDDTVTTFGSVSTGANKYYGGTLAPNSVIYGIPFNSTSILKIEDIGDYKLYLGSPLINKL